MREGDRAAVMPLALGSLREALDGLDENDCCDACRLEFAPGVAEEGLHCGGIEPAADLIRSRDGEALAGSGEGTADQRLALGFGTFEDRVGVADRVGESFVAEIMESIMMRGSLGHG